MPSGVLVIDKPAGPTSFDVVQRVRRLLRAEKAGHAGTLDPAATGLLAVCLDEGVKIQRWLADGDKEYQATVAFGAATDTEDAQGEVVARGDPAGIDEPALRAALAPFVGEIEQVPPMYSAVRVGGRRLHRAARAGEEVAREPRRVRIHALELAAIEPLRDGILRAHLSVSCGKGTYVRTLAADLGRALGVPAHLAALRRTRAGPFGLEGALTLAQAEEMGREGAGPLRARLVSPADALGFLPAERLSAAEARDLVHGRALARPGSADGLVRALGPGGRLVAVAEVRGGALRPVRVLATPAEVGAESDPSPGDGGRPG
ncbi:MAG TPA: tRNA pseudouridine(55) synthase TruB [Anaeromyxobacteraceae bacterium]|nr:tRNA pseudouridine(55) synthase TruB [Anaeromyxobacteraceae bacterium]